MKVSIYTQADRLMLNFRYQGKRHRVALGYPDKPHFRLKAETIARQIELDILANNFKGVDHYVESRPTPESKPPKKKQNKPGYLYPHNPKRDPFTKEEISRILEALYSNEFCSKYSPVKHSQYAPFYHFMLLTGMRSAEVVGLQHKHIDYIRSTIEVSSVLARSGNCTSSKSRVRKLPKTGTKGIRYIPMNQQLRTLLLSIKPENSNPDDLVFKSPRGLSIDDKNTLNRIWKPVLAALGIPYRVPYALRHTRATQLIEESSLPINQVSYVLGHANTRTTLDIYVSNRKPDRLPEF